MNTIKISISALLSFLLLINQPSLALGSPTGSPGRISEGSLSVDSFERADLFEETEGLSITPRSFSGDYLSQLEQQTARNASPCSGRKCAYSTLAVGGLVGLSVFLIVFLSHHNTQEPLWICNPKVDQCQFSYRTGNSQIQYFSNIDFADTNRTVPTHSNFSPITKLIIGIEGNERSPQTLFRGLYNATEAEGKLRNYALVVPWLKGNNYHGSTSCSDDDCDPVASDELYWSTDGWKQGDKSLSTEKVSSFELVDEIVGRYVNSGDFPNLKTIVVTGHSAGGQFVQRYAIGTAIDESFPNVRFVVCNPSSYLYFDSRRPTWAGLYPKGGVYPAYGLEATNVSRPDFMNPYDREKTPFKEAKEFKSIVDGSDPKQDASCRCTDLSPCSYEKYKYGFDFEPFEPNHYMCSNNEYQTCSKSITQSERIKNFLKKDVTYILGQLDNGTPMGAEGANKELDMSCAGNFQGPDRLSRGTFYFEFLGEYGEHRHRLIFAPQTGHSAMDIYRSNQARRSLFENSDLPVKEYLAPLYSIRQKGSQLFLDSVSSDPSSAVAHSADKELDQSWILTKVGPKESEGYRIQQQKTLNYLEASSNGEVLLAGFRNSDAQIWMISSMDSKSDTYTIQAKSNQNFLGSHQGSEYLRAAQNGGLDSVPEWVIQAKENPFLKNKR